MESLPYIVLEAAAASKPMIATNVGGIAEIFGPHSDRLIASDDTFALANAMNTERMRCTTALSSRTAALKEFVQSRFSMTQMVNTVLQGYQQAIESRHGKSSQAQFISAGQR